MSDAEESQKMLCTFFKKKGGVVGGDFHLFTMIMSEIQAENFFGSLTNPNEIATDMIFERRV
jgi:hypothetical protein